MMRTLGMMLCFAALSGCVVGYGPCMLVKPFKQTVTGRVHFRDYPGPDGTDNVPILTMDTTAYVYAPAQSSHCLAANDVQLVGFSEFPQDVVENTHVTVQGSFFSATSSRQHTAFLIDVRSVLPIKPQPKEEAQ
ncbi:MAG TPA: hypothetical protein VGI93_22390 [Steroidobacteraceae bacterium]